MNQQPKIQIDVVARHDLDETFVDSLTNMSFDGQCWRIEFAVTRMEQAKPATNTLTGKRVPVCRLILPAKAGFDFASKLDAMIKQMEQQGMIKKTPIMPMAPGSSKPN